MREEKEFIRILESELVPALGCTEPIAVAYASAKARDILGSFPRCMQLYCSGNVIKNVKGVTVPNSGGMRGIAAAGVLGVVGGDSSKELEVLGTVTKGDIERTKELISSDFVECKLQEGVENLYICVIAYGDDHKSEVRIEKHHTNITYISKDDKVIFSKIDDAYSEDELDMSILSVESIIGFADNVNLNKVKSLLDRQIEMNSRISDEGINNCYGAQIGRILLKTEGDSIMVKAKARAAAGSDARMGGCSLPVVINSGSGNQGITVSLPVIEYAKELGVKKDSLYRALLVSNLLSIHIKRHIGSLSAFCGAVSASCAAAAAISYMCGASFEQICATITNTLGNSSGIICDGAKASCAAKIACALEAGLMAHNMSMEGLNFSAGSGVIKESIEDTIKSIGYVGKYGMKQTDVEILRLMLDEVKLR